MLFIYLAGNADEEVDHGIGLLFLHRFGKESLGARHRLTAGKDLLKPTQTQYS